MRRVEEFLVQPDEDVGDYQRWLDTLSLGDFLEAMNAELRGEVPDGYREQLNFLDKNKQN